MSQAKLRVILAICLLALCNLPALAQRLVIVGWNLESGESSDSFIANRVRTFQGVDIWGLSEVAGQATATTFEAAAEDGENADFRNVLSTTGRGDRLAIVYNFTRFELLNQFEVHRVTFNADQPTPNSGQRSPLAVELRDRTTGKRLIFMVNHLARGDNNLRRDQAARLKEWVQQQTIPVIAVGDYNFDWDVNNGENNHDQGFDNMTAGGAWTWVRPATLIKTQCDAAFNSVLDFVFVNVPARDWRGVSTILQETGDCNDDAQKPDHRPLRAEFDLSGAPPVGTPTKAEILQRIEELERQLQQLKEMVNRLP